MRDLSLLERTAALVDVPSVSHNEQELAGIVAEALARQGALEVRRIGDNVVARHRAGEAAPLVLAGHLDTVPPAGNSRARVEGERCIGLGAADMKGGLAVLLTLAEGLREQDRPTTFVFYAREEVARVHSGLLEIEASAPELLRGEAAVLLEPTGARIEAGCQGVLRVEVVLAGVRAHSARPWVGENAIHRLGPLIERIATSPERRPVIDGCEYRETLQVVGVSGGVAGNVVPDEAHLVVSHRFAPDRDVERAFDHLRALFGELVDPGRGDRIELLDASPAAPPHLSHPLLERLVRATGREPAAKIAWTDVAFFSERGVPAVNYGPGDPLLAHRADEFVEAAELEAVHDALRELISD